MLASIYILVLAVKKLTRLRSLSFAAYYAKSVYEWDHPEIVDINCLLIVAKSHIIVATTPIK